MVKNRNKIIKAMIGNIANTVIHRILKKAVSLEELREKYTKEIISSFEVAKKYREKVNPKFEILDMQEQDLIKKKVVTRVSSEIELRISKGYQNLSLEGIEEEIEIILKELGII
jgi:hypothetical protein